MSSTSSPGSDNANIKYNFPVMVVESSVFMMGVAFMEVNTIFPQFLSCMGADAQFIGFIQGLRQLVFFIPYPYAMGLVRGKPQVKPYLFRACLYGRTPLLLAALVLWFQPASQWLSIFCAVAAMLLFTFGDGLGCLPWYELVGRLIPARSRGRFFGSMQTLGALSALGASLVVPKVLKAPGLSTTHRYALLFVCMGSLLAFSTFLISRIREGHQQYHEDEQDQLQGFWDHIKHVPVCWKRDQALRRLIYTQLLITGEGLSMTFYGLYAIKEFNLSAEWMGYFLTAQNVGATVTGPIWGFVADRLGAIRSLKVMVPLAMIAPAVALLAPSPYAFFFVFGSIGAVVFGVWACMTNTALAIAPKIDRPTYIALQQLANFPLSITPVIGGLLVKNFSYPLVFTLTLICVSCGAFMAYRIPEHTANS